MKKFLLIILIFCLLIPSGMAQTSQEPAIMSGCDPRVVELIQPYAMGERVPDTTPLPIAPYRLDYAGACEEYLACTPDLGFDSACNFEMLGTLISQCPADDENCILFAVALTSSVHFYTNFIFADDPYDDGGGNNEALLESSRELRSGLFYFQFPWNLESTIQRLEQAYGKANNAYANYSHPYYYLLYGLILSVGGQYEHALEQFERGMELYWFFDPLYAYARLLVYVRQGADLGAILDAEQLRDYFGDDVPSFVAPLLAEYRLDDRPFEEWVGYPLSVNYISPVGDFYELLVQDDPHPLRVEFLPDEIVIIDGLPNLGVIRIDRLFPDPESYGEPQINLLTGDVYELVIPRHEFESGGITRYLVARAGEPDPRLELSGFRCADGRMARLMQGAQFYLADAGYLYVYSEPESEEPTFVRSGRFDVISDGLCTDSAIWWEVRSTDGLVQGWINDESGVYSNSSYLPFYCPGAPAPRLLLNSEARVVRGLGANNLRSAPTSDSELLAQIPEGEIVGIQRLDPICNASMIWWSAYYNGLFGWTAEGTDGIYWLEPLGSETTAP